MVVNQYGYTSAYGDGPYKGEPQDAIPGVVRGVAFAETRKCLHFGFTEEQGLGWAEDKDGDLAWPESQAAVVECLDENAEAITIVFDEKTGLPYIINTFNGPRGKRYVKRYKDKVDPNLPGSGTDIPVTIKQGEHTGEDRNFIITNVEQRVTLRPINALNRGAPGYDASGLPSGFTLDAEMYTDGALSASTSIETIPLDSEYVFDHEARGHTLQQKLISNLAEFRLTRIRSVYRVSEVAEIPAKGNTTEAGYQQLLARPVLWLSRGPSLLLDRATGKTITGTVTAITGPDGKSNSAMRFVDPIALENPAQTNGCFMLWARSGYTISGLTLEEYDHSSTWYLYYTMGTIPANIILPAGDVFDIRIYSTNISIDAIADYYTDVTGHSGKNYLPRW